MTGYLVAHDDILVARMPQEARDKLNAYLGERVEEMNALLEPYGLSMSDVQQPEWTIVVSPLSVKFHGLPEELEAVGANLLSVVAEHRVKSAEADQPEPTIDIPAD